MKHHDIPIGRSGRNYLRLSGSEARGRLCAHPSRQDRRFGGACSSGRKRYACITLGVMRPRPSSRGRQTECGAMHAGIMHQLIARAQADAVASVLLASASGTADGTGSR